MHGKIMLPLATLVSLNAFIGEMNPTIDFHVFAYVDVSLKMLFWYFIVTIGFDNEDKHAAARPMPRMRITSCPNNDSAINDILRRFVDPWPTRELFPTVRKELPRWISISHC
ncbi:DUF6609 family protein [Brevibacillus sp. HB1.2]|uniref:DUF6609 family protein n=1 Tax=Brevibacillus sp. HB1.2 TaxID=2738807 RepID=UPI0035302283